MGGLRLGFREHPGFGGWRGRIQGLRFGGLGFGVWGLGFGV